MEKGNLNISTNDKEILWKNKVFFKECKSEGLYKEYTRIIEDDFVLKNKPMFIIITDYQKILALDIETEETIDIDIKELATNYTFFLPWAGMKKAIMQIDNPAEYTGIFEEKIFTKSIVSYTQQDGSDLDYFLKRIFKILNEENRDGYPEYLKKFPYVGGDLFEGEGVELSFNLKSRQAIIDNGELNWAEINPDIFGSMIQAVVNANERSNLGMHYTSVPNIMKVINPLFLDELYEEFENAKKDIVKLKKLITRLSKMKIYDPACGSGNFLIIAYKELRELEMKIIEQINKLDMQVYWQGTSISLSQFYGIEIKDFAQQIAKLSLWLMEKKMDFKFHSEFGYSKPTLPLNESSNIVKGNATRIDWNEVCNIKDTDEVYVLGNPPYLGSKLQDIEQRADLDIVFKGMKKYKELDYIGCWFYKGAKYIKGYNAKCAFVSTNSICQGEQVGLLWPNIFKLGININFAHTSFKWENNAKNNAAVICVIVGLANNEEKLIKKLYSDGIEKITKNINPYLIEGRNITIEECEKPISKFPEIKFGNMANDGGGLIFSTQEKEEIIDKYPQTGKFFKKLIGAQEFIQRKVRWCLWIEDEDLDEAMMYKPIKERIEIVKKHRLDSKDSGTNKLASRPHQFRDRNVIIDSAIIVPRVSSERRDYIPIGFLDNQSIISDSAQAIYDSELWIFGVITSKMHMLWVKTVGGRLKSDYRYSKKICYNTFPFPQINNKQKEIISECVFKIIDEREKNLEKSLAFLYDPNKMPLGLRLAHEELDIIIEECYSKKKFNSDEERLECLFNLYEKMRAEGVE